MRKTILILLFILFLSMGSFAAYQIYQSLSEYNEGTSTYENLQTYVTVDDTKAPTDTDPETEETPTVEENINWPKVDFDSLKALNDDIVGWIYLEDTHVNYPMVQGVDNAYYLKRMYDGTGNGSGSIFVDYRNSSDFSDHNTIIYGHHMINDSMLSDIVLYKKQSFYDEHPYMLMMTPEKNYKIEIVSGYVATLEDNAWPLNFGAEESFKNWIDFTVSKSAIKSKVTPTMEDRFVTFSTCTYEFEEARYVLVGVLREYDIPETE